MHARLFSYSSSIAGPSSLSLSFFLSFFLSLSLRFYPIPKQKHRINKARVLQFTPFLPFLSFSGTRSRNAAAISVSWNAFNVISGSLSLSLSLFQRRQRKQKKKQKNKSRQQQQQQQQQQQRGALTSSRRIFSKQSTSERCSRTADKYYYAMQWRYSQPVPLATTQKKTTKTEEQKNDRRISIRRKKQNKKTKTFDGLEVERSATNPVARNADRCLFLPIGWPRSQSSAALMNEPRFGIENTTPAEIDGQKTPRMARPVNEMTPRINGIPAKRNFYYVVDK